MKLPDLFMILSRDGGECAQRLSRNLEGVADTVTIVDHEDGHGVYIPTEICLERNFADIARYHDGQPRVQAWERALAFCLSDEIRNYPHVWFMEDDVAADADSLRQLVHGFRSHTGQGFIATDLHYPEEPGESNWPHWRKTVSTYGFPPAWARTMNPLCRMSRGYRDDLLKLVQGFPGHRFQEVFFASAAVYNGWGAGDFRDLPWCRDLFPSFGYRPIVTEDPVAPGIYHPVKDLEVHRAICSR